MRSSEIIAAFSAISDVIGATVQGEQMISETSACMQALLGSKKDMRGLRGMFQKINGSERLLRPYQRLNRIELLAASASPEAIDSSYRIHDALPVIHSVSKDTALQIRELLGCMNNYDPYINIRAVLGRKDLLLSKYADGEQSTRDQRFAVSAVQILDIMKDQKIKAAQRNNSSRLSPYPYKKANDAVRIFLSLTGSSSTFTDMGFNCDGDLDNHDVPEDHPALPRTTFLSNSEEEHTFIVLHQVFETLFQDALHVLDELEREGLDDSAVADKLQDLSNIIRTSSKFYPILHILLKKDPFLIMRDYFGIASGAQSQQYHLMETRIGLPFGEEFAVERRKDLGFIIGKQRLDELRTEEGRSPSLKQRFAIVPSMTVANGLRAVDIALLQFKSAHGRTMLLYLEPADQGTAGTKITEYFASNIGTVFPVFTDEEKRLIDLHSKKAIFHAGQEYKDYFKSVHAYVSGELPAAVPEGFLTTSSRGEISSLQK